MAIEWSDTPHIGGMKPWACSYDKGGVRYGITLYGTSPDQVLEDNCDTLPGLTVDGEQVSTGKDKGGRPDDPMY